MVEKNKYCRLLDGLCNLASYNVGVTTCSQGAHDECPYDEHLRILEGEVGEHETIH